MNKLDPCAVWAFSPQLLLALQDNLGDPLDSYVNGSQVWFTDEGEVTLEWRLHPAAGYQRPPGMATTAVFPSIVMAVANEVQPPLDPVKVWGGLELFIAFEGDFEPAELAAIGERKLTMPPDAFGFVDHRKAGDAWENSRGAVSLIDLLLAQLRPS